MGIRVWKTAAAVFVSIALAKWMHLHYALGAGLLAILGIDITLRRSFRTVSVRILASITGLALASIIFYIMGFHLWTISLYILLAYPVLVKVKLADGIVTSSVVVFHIVDQKTVSWSGFRNEVLLLLVGLGTASLINILYMPRADKKLAVVRKQVDDLFSEIFLHLAAHLRNPAQVWDGRELLMASDTIHTGHELARRSAENKLFQTEESWLRYFDMRRQHFDSIQRMLALVAQVYETLPHGEAVAGLFDSLSESVKSEFYGGYVETGLLELEQDFRSMPLPVSREEFEMRSAILQLCLELKTYLSMAKKVKKRASDPDPDLL